MATGSTGSGEPGSGASNTVRTRDADGTRQRLLQSARYRFARDGYSGTTVREIASDAGVNVALINRYFTSKEGLFAACLRWVVEDLDPSTNAQQSVDQILETMVNQLAGLPSGAHAPQLLLLLRSSGDQRADEIRRTTLKSFAEAMAAAAGWRPETTNSEALLLRAQIALSTALGVVLLRSSTGLEPLTSATAQELREPLRDTLETLLSAPLTRQRSSHSGSEPQADDGFRE